VDVKVREYVSVDIKMIDLEAFSGARGSAVVFETEVKQPLANGRDRRGSKDVITVFIPEPWLYKACGNQWMHPFLIHI